MDKLVESLIEMYDLSAEYLMRCVKNGCKEETVMMEARIAYLEEEFESCDVELEALTEKDNERMGR